ncbi:unnamed protein product [Caenorhabditis angaria]|uniref:Uncharacterized protein n=1 Tax=Caenorhabditis angaria TaxID=860376 RepID=A0A9P1IE40_9PELO|nr:unnamed protein product [Caenorhabditis angaria]
MRFLLTILAILPLLIVSDLNPNWALHQAQYFQTEFLEHLKKQDFKGLAISIDKNFEFIVSHGDRRLLQQDKNTYVDYLRNNRDLFSSGKIVSAKTSGFSVEFEIKPKRGYGNHKAVMIPNSRQYGPRLVRYEIPIYSL